ALRQLGPQQAHELGGRPVPFLQREQDLAVERAERSGVAVRQIDPAVRNAQVVEDRLELVLWDQLADRRLDVVGDARRLLDPRAGRRAQVEPDLAGVDAREEVAPEERSEAAREQAEREEADAEDAALLQERAERDRVGAADALELAVEGVVDALEDARRTARLRVGAV